MWERILFMAALVLVSVPSYALAEAPKKGKLCQGRMTQIEVVPTFGVVEEDHSLMTTADLTTPAGWDTSLIPHITIEPRLTAQNTYTRVVKDQESCQILNKAQISYRIDVMLHLSNNFTQGGCQYNQVQSHKAQHVSVVKNFMVQSTPLLQNYLEGSLKGRAAVSDVEIGSEKAQAKLNETMNNILAGYAKYLEREHATLQSQIVDTTAEMEKMYTTCPEWSPAAGP